VYPSFLAFATSLGSSLKYWLPSLIYGKLLGLTGVEGFEGFDSGEGFGGNLSCEIPQRIAPVDRPITQTMTTKKMKGTIKYMLDYSMNTLKLLIRLAFVFAFTEGFFAFVRNNLPFGR